MKKVLDKIESSPLTASLITRMQQSDGMTTLGGINPSLGCMLAACLLDRMKGDVLVVAPDPRTLENALDDLVTVLGSERVGHLPPLRQHPFDTAPLASGPRNERVEALLRLQSVEPSVIVTLPEALLEPAPDRASISRSIHRLNLGERLNREQLIADLVAADYRREALVAEQGQFAVRGGLLDLYPYGYEDPVRIELDGDVISDMRLFRTSDQRSIGALTSVALLLGATAGVSTKGVAPSDYTVLDLLPDNSTIFWLGLNEIIERAQRFIEHAAPTSSGGAGGPRLPSENPPHYRTLDEVTSAADNRSQLVWFGPLHRGKVDFKFGARRVDPYHGGYSGLKPYFDRITGRGMTVWLAADTLGEKERLEEQLHDEGVAGVGTALPALSEGFQSEELGLALVNSHELYQRRRMRARHTRFRRKSVQFDRSSLKRGDFVVHREYGIGIYEGMRILKVRGQPTECLRLKYLNDVVLYVKVEHFGMVEKFVGGEGAQPKLSRIGGVDWERTKSRTRKALRDMSAELIDLYAKRKLAKGAAFSADTHWQREMEASFEFDDTPDQVSATVEVKADLEAPHPMDRLLCGDVGFGKTEIAVRAAFKVVQDSHQVAVLVPTTILAQQHHETFRSRLAQYPVRIEALSRFRSAAEQKKIVAGLKSGEVDIVIGTHRLLSKDVGFKNLGLVIVDEEHRFGVRHKERLKMMRGDVDVLTLTATPIPRTLQLALSGARDTSQINTPPMDRLPVQTEIIPWSEDLIRDAIFRELDRQGQVFFVHNRVQSIHAVQGMLERLCPGLRYAIAHGQMPEQQLERVMIDFLHQRYDLLISTMIIESGLDLPNVNTLIVNRADRLGLAQLYQLRGRIGRSNRQAYAWLLTPPVDALTIDARRRLQTISELTELGSGMKVALRDLEIRGAGNLLGAEQSGYINAVGFDMFTRLLDEAVAELKGRTVAQDSVPAEEIKLELDTPAMLPADYIEDGDQRYDFYRRIASAASQEQLGAITTELSDRYGKLPDPAGNLIAAARLKLLCVQLGFGKLRLVNDHLVAELRLPGEPAAAQTYLGRLVAAAAPDEIEFRMNDPIELIHRFNGSNPLQRSLGFLTRLQNQSILKD